MTPQLECKHGQNFSLAHAGEWSNLSQHIFKHPILGNVTGKLFLKEPLRMTGLEVSLGVIPPGRGTPFLHRHRHNEELYIFVKGRGQFLIDNEVLEVREGTVIRVAPSGARAWRNTSTEDLYYIVIQAKAGTLDAPTTTDGLPLPGAPQWNPKQ